MKTEKMLKQLIEHMENLQVWKIALLILLLTVAIELITIFFRFGLDLRSTRDTAFLSVITFGLRIHHGYIGFVMIAAALLIQQPVLRNLLIIIGTSMLFSDIIHHFIVLKSVTGDSEFDFFYKIK